MGEAAVIVIPMVPPRECNPNWHGHWRQKVAAVKAFRAAAYYVAREARMRDAVAWAAAWPVNGERAVMMDIHVSYAGWRPLMDSDNLVASCKAARDGIADALFNGEDGHIQVGRATQEVRGDGVTQITLRALAGSEG